MRITLHLGAHKTCTTLLQKCLSTSSEILASKRIGIMLLREVNSYLGSWAKELPLDPSRFAAAIKEHEDKGNEHLVISCEDLIGPAVIARVPGLYPVATPRLEALARLLKDCDTKTVCYLRPQSEFIQSYYLQTVKMGNATPFSKWYGGLNIESLSWEPLVSCMRKLFGAEKSCIEDFRSIQNGVDKFIESFAKNCRIQLQLKKPKNVFQNLSLGKKGLEIALLVNPLLKGHELQKMRFFLEKNFL